MLYSILSSVLCLHDKTLVRSPRGVDFKGIENVLPDNTRKGPVDSFVKAAPSSIFYMFYCFANKAYLDCYLSGGMLIRWMFATGTNCQAGYCVWRPSFPFLKHRATCQCVDELHLCSLYMQEDKLLWICVPFLTVLKLCLKGQTVRLLCLHFLPSVGSVGKCEAWRAEILWKHFFNSALWLSVLSWQKSAHSLWLVPHIANEPRHLTTQSPSQRNSIVEILIQECLHGVLKYWWSGSTTVNNLVYLEKGPVSIRYFWILSTLFINFNYYMSNTIKVLDTLQSTRKTLLPNNVYLSQNIISYSLCMQNNAS